jgi:predicted PurR-regulated permease PerM
MAAARALLPAAMRERASSTASEVDTVLGQFVRGQLIVMAILGALYAGGYALIGVRLAIPIGIIAGLLSFIPYVGSGVALGLALLMTALDLGSPLQFVKVLAVYAVVQTLEGFVITPRIVGDKLGLPPVVVLIALMIGGELFGFLGVMLALPVSAVVKVFAGHALVRYQASELFSGMAASRAAIRQPARLRLRRGRGASRRHRTVR